MKIKSKNSIIYFWDSQKLAILFFILLIKKGNFIILPLNNYKRGVVIMAGKVTWAIGSFIGGALAYGLAKYLFDEDESKVVYCKSDMSDDVLTALLDKLQKAGDAKGLYDFGCILEKEDIDWARKFLKAAAGMDFAIAQNKLRSLDED